MKKLVIIQISICLLSISASLLAQEKPTDDGDTKTTSKQFLPIGAQWAKDRGIDLPKPFGVSAFFIYMKRDIDVTNVDITLPDREPQSINDFASFGVSNQTAVTALRFDAWILPVLNIYVLGGYTLTNSSLDATFTIDRIILPKPPITIDVNQKSQVGGPYAGIGTSLVAGHGHWFILADANYGITWLDELEGKINFWMFSGRTGWSGSREKNNWRAWVGGVYLSSKRTLTLVTYKDGIGNIKIDIEQQPVNPWTMSLGGSIGLGKRFEIMTELGSNFNDAFLAVVTGTYRF